MSLIPWKEKQGVSGRFGALQKEINRMFEDVLGGMPGFANETGFPALTTSETDTHVVVKAEVPGIPSENIEVSVKDDVLTIKGEKKEEKKEEKENFFRVERSFGSFLRQIPLPSKVDPKGAETKLENGLLELRLPRLPEKEAEKSVKIEIK